jgi:dynein heavy chain, axonemal
MTSAEP